MVVPKHQFELRPHKGTLMHQVGFGIGGMLSVVHGFNTGIPYVQKHVKGAKGRLFVIGLPPMLMFSAASAAFGGYTLPRFTQLTVISYYSATNASHYGVILLTRHVEEDLFLFPEFNIKNLAD